MEIAEGEEEKREEREEREEKKKVCSWLGRRREICSCKRERLPF